MFESKSKSKKKEAQEREECLLKIIRAQKVDIDFKKGLVVKSVKRRRIRINKGSVALIILLKNKIV